MNFRPLFFGLAAIFFTVGLSANASAADLKTTRAEVRDFTLKTLSGDEVKLSDLRGKVVLIDFWATWCKPCQQELPFLSDYYEQLKDQGLVVLAISTDDARTISGVRRVVKRRKLKMPVLLDQDGAVMADLNPRGAMPYALLLDRQGRLAADHDGYASGDEVALLKTLKALLAEMPTTQKAKP